MPHCPCSRAELARLPAAVEQAAGEGSEPTVRQRARGARSVGANARPSRGRPAGAGARAGELVVGGARGSRNRTSSRSARCDGVTFCRLRNSRSVRPGSCCSQRREHGLDLAPFHVVLRAAQIARNDRKLAAARVARNLALGAVRERPDHDVLAVVALQLRRHRFQARAEEHVQEQRLDDVVAMVAERDLGGAELVGDAIQECRGAGASKARTSSCRAR